jgi:magnesium chelatase family protein
MAYDAYTSDLQARAAGSAAFPARFQMIGAANPCRRGCASLEACVCTADEKRQYLARLSRPLMTGSTCISTYRPCPMERLRAPRSTWTRDL